MVSGLLYLRQRSGTLVNMIDKLATAAIDHRNIAVSVGPPDAELVQSGRWEAESPEFTV